ncbi:MAG: hypothetical protein V1833_00735 [Elusimicrobiota bacterium]
MSKKSKRQRLSARGGSANSSGGGKWRLGDRRTYSAIFQSRVHDSRFTIHGFTGGKKMLTTVRGICENGEIRPLEKIRIKGKSDIIITFLDTGKERKHTFLSSAGSWKGTDTEALKKQIYENRKISTRGKVKL